MNFGKRVNRGSGASPIGSGYFILSIIGLLIVVFAMSFIVYSVGVGVFSRLFANRPCALWFFVVLLLIFGLALSWLGERQGYKRLKK